MNAELSSYLETALWSSTDDAGEPLDAKYSFDDIAPKSMAKAALDVAAFLEKAGPIIAACDPTEKFRPNVGHDFWLTRNGHGAGFWDGDYPKAAGDVLTALCKEFGECNAIVGDDGKIYFEGGK